MVSVQSIFWKIAKAFIWLVGIFVLIFLVTAVLIQIPAIQNKIVHFATSLISNKTHSKVEMKSVRISFPKSVVIKGLYLEDLRKDTLLYLGNAKVNISLYDLFHHKVAINSLEMEEVKMNLISTGTDSLFNYNFLLTAFSDTTRQANVLPETATKWTFSLKQVTLKNLQLLYNNKYVGINVISWLKNLNLKMDQIDAVKSVYNIDQLLIDGATANILIEKSKNSQNNKSGSSLPRITANKIELHNSSISYADSITKMAIMAVINGFELKNSAVDLQNEMASADKIALLKSDIQYRKFGSGESTSKLVADSAESANTDWKVRLKSIQSVDNSVTYLLIDKPAIRHAFDANHQVYKHLAFNASDFYYSSDQTNFSIKNFTVVDQNSLSIAGFETDFRMDGHSITVKNLKAKTTSSSIDADLNLQYTSVETLLDSLQFSSLKLNIKNATVKTSDILYFKPDLNEMPFFKDSLNVTSISGNISGKINNLHGEKLLLKTGANTILNTDFTITGLPEFKTSVYNFPNLGISSGKKDIEMFAGLSVPLSIDLPENIGMQMAFKGRIKSFESTISLTSSFGDANLVASVDPGENFKGRLILTGFDLGSLLKDKAWYGPVSLNADANGQGLDFETIKAKFNAEVTQFNLNNYTYQNLKMMGDVSGKILDTKIILKDKNAAFELDGQVNLNAGQDHYKFNLNLLGADLQKLNFASDDLQLGLVVSADFTGGGVNELTGKAGITNVVIVHRGKKYQLDSFLTASANLPAKEELNAGNSIIGLKYTGKVSPTALPEMLRQHLNKYFPFSDSNQQLNISDHSQFTLGIQLRNHPILTEVFFPELKEFEPGIIEGSFDSQKSNLKLNATIKKLVYGANEVQDLSFELDSDPTAIKFKLSCGNISNSLVSLDHLIVDGKATDNKISTSVSSIDEKKNKKLVVSFITVKDKSNFRYMLDPSGFYLMNNRWDIAADNFIEFGKEGFLIHHLFMKNAESQINIASVHDRFNDDQNIAFRNFKLQDISGIIKKDTALIKGKVDGELLLKRVNNSYGLVADAKIANLTINNIPIGSLSVKADNTTTEKFNIAANLSGPDNNLSANGSFIPNGGEKSIHIKTEIQSLSLKTIEAFSIGTFTKGSGNLTGNLLIEGNSKFPEVTGELLFRNAFFTPAFLNNPLELKHETLKFEKDEIYFNAFTILDAHQHPATINGEVKMNHFSDFSFGLKLTTKDFLLFDTSVRDNKEFYGRMIIDSNVDISGPLALPVVNAKFKMKKGSNFTIAVPEDRLTTDKGEDVVEFESGSKLNPILYQANKNALPKTTLKGFDVSSIIEIDKEATLRLLMDPSSTDSLVVRGEAALSFAIDRSGKMSLTGAYNLNDGSYLASLQSIIKRKFIIDTGSTIIWNGDPYDADIVINARYAVRASPFDLVADQLSAVNEADINGYRERYPFIVMLKLRGKILHPEISFEIQLSPEDKGILSGAVDQKLSMLNEDPSALNKQVFALLVLGRFLQENPLQSESNSASTIVRATVGKFLSQQLNQWSSKVIPGVDLNFDIQSYNDYQAGTAQGRTQVDIGLKKPLFNERLNIQLGGTVDVEGTTAGQNSASDIASDVTVAYKLTKDGRFSLKGYRHNKYEGVIDGQLVETGIGVLFEHDFNKWKKFFKTSKSKNDTLKKGKSNETINPK